MDNKKSYIKAALSAAEEQELFLGLAIDLENLVLDKNNGLKARMTEIKKNLNSKTRLNLAHIARLFAKTEDVIINAKALLAEIQPIRQGYTSEATKVIFSCKTELDQSLLPKFVNTYKERLDAIYRSCFENNDALAIDSKKLQTLLKKKNLSDEDIAKIKTCCSSLNHKISATKGLLDQLKSDECFKLIKKDIGLQNRLNEVKRFAEECLDLIQQGQNILKYSDSALPKEDKSSGNFIDVKYSVSNESASTDDSPEPIKRDEKPKKKDEKPDKSDSGQETTSSDISLADSPVDISSISSAKDLVDPLKTAINPKRKKALKRNFMWHTWSFFVNTFLVFTLACFCLFCFSAFFATANSFDLFILFLGSSVIGKIVG